MLVKGNQFFTVSKPQKAMKQISNCFKMSAVREAKGYQPEKRKISLSLNCKIYWCSPYQTRLTSMISLDFFKHPVVQRWSVVVEALVRVILLAPGWCISKSLRNENLIKIAQVLFKFSITTPPQWMLFKSILTQVAFGGKYFFYSI